MKIKEHDLVFLPTGKWSHIAGPTLPGFPDQRRTICGRLIPPDSKGVIWDRQTTSEPGCHMCFVYMQKQWLDKTPQGD